MDDAAEFMRLMDKSDIAGLRALLDRAPALLDEKLSWDSGYDGYALHYAAWRNQPEVIDFLVLEKKADVNRNQNVGSNWTPLNHAEKKNSFKAAARLLDFGADPAKSSTDIQAFAKQPAVQQERDPLHREKVRQKAAEEKEKRLAGFWTRTGDQEVSHDYERPDSRQRLTDSFNFETRIWRATSRDMDGKGMAQNIVFFDDMPDTTIVAAALKKLQELGGKVDDDAVFSRQMDKKRLGAALKPAGAG